MGNAAAGGTVRACGLDAFEGLCSDRKPARTANVVSQMKAESARQESAPSLIASQTDSDLDLGSSQRTTLAGNEAFCARVFAIPGNQECADCTGGTLLTWASSNLGVVLCNECVGAHRSLGVHVSKPRSLKMDGWDDYLQQLMLSRGNAKVNAEFEAHPNASTCKPAASASLEAKMAFIKSKYADLAFKTGGSGLCAAGET
jgi:hypothetical protein